MARPSRIATERLLLRRPGALPLAIGNGGCVLAKCGFVLMGEGEEAGTIRFELKRDRR